MGPSSFFCIEDDDYLLDFCYARASRHGPLGKDQKGGPLFSLLFSLVVLKFAAAAAAAVPWELVAERTFTSRKRETIASS